MCESSESADGAAADSAIRSGWLLQGLQGLLGLGNAWARPGSHPAAPTIREAAAPRLGPNRQPPVGTPAPPSPHWLESKRGPGEGSVVVSGDWQTVAVPGPGLLQAGLPPPPSRLAYASRRVVFFPCHPRSGNTVYRARVFTTEGGRWQGVWIRRQGPRSPAAPRDVMAT